MEPKVKKFLDNYLPYGAVSEVARELDYKRPYVSGVRNGKYESIKIISALVDKAASNRDMIKGIEDKIK